MLTAAELVAEAKSKIREITPAEAAKSRGGLIIIDVREPQEYAAGHIPGAANIPRGLIEFKVDNHPMLMDRNAAIVLHCQGGGRSALAAVALQKLGFKHVSNLAGGFGARSATGLPTER